MSTDKTTGGPAFPRTGYYPDTGGSLDEFRERIDFRTEPQAGLTVRDYFAAKAIATAEKIVGDIPIRVLADRFCEGRSSLSPGDMPRIISLVAYELADAMLAAR